MPLETKYYGPYPHNGGYRCLVLINGRRRWAPMEATAHEAEKTAQRCIDRLYSAHPMEVGEALAEYPSHMEAKNNKPGSIKGTMAKLNRFFASVLDTPLERINASRAAGLYERLRTEPSPYTKRPLSVDSHRNMLAEAKTFLEWCIERRWLRVNPLAAVKGVGKRRHGKPQLRIDEARRLRQRCHMEAAKGDDGAVGALMALLMGMRAGEITGATVRDLDDGGRLLWIPDAKTPAGRRTIEIPPELQPHLLTCAEGQGPDAPLFRAEGGGKHWRDWVRKQTRRLCRLAGVPELCAHSMRGFAATVAVQSGAAPHLITAALGHVDISTTLQSYAAPGSAQIAQQRRALALLGGPTSPPNAPPN